MIPKVIIALILKQVIINNDLLKNRNMYCS